MRYCDLTDDRSYAVGQVREGSGPPVFFIGGYNSGRSWAGWQNLVNSKYRGSEAHQVYWPNSGTITPHGFNNAESRAELCGRLLADHLAHHFQGQWPVLVGHSLGARVAATAADELTKNYGAGQLTAVHLLGAPLHRSEGWVDRLAYATTGGVHNYYSHWEIGTIELGYGISIGFKSKPIGTLGFGADASNYPLINDWNVTKWVRPQIPEFDPHRAYFEKVALM